MGQNDTYSRLIGDANGDGITDMIAMATGPSGMVILASERSAATPVDVLSSVTDSLGKVMTVGYAPLTDDTVYTKGSGAVFPELDVQAPLYVVKEVSQDDGVGGQAVTSYRYSGAKVHLQGRGFLGFAEVVSTDGPTGIVTTTRYRQDYPFAGQVESSETALADGTLVKTVANSWASRDLNGGASVFPHVTVSSAQDYETDDGPGNSPVTTTATDSIYDDFGNPTQIVITTTGGGKTFTKTTVNTYGNDTAKWLLGRLSRAEVTNQRPGAPPATRASAFLYDGTSGLLTRETIEPDIPALSLVTDYTYDAFGNQTAVTVSGADITSRTTTTTYTADGRFVATVGNALGHVESHLYDARFGTLAGLTGPNLLQTAWAYDGFGRKVLESRADGTETAWSYDLCAAQCPAGGVYAVTREDRIAATATPYAAKGIEYFDLLNRAFRSETEGFDGTAIYSDSQFNARGEVTAVSRPYFAGTAAQDIQWVQTSYDAVGRAVSVTQPDGGVTSIGYNGLTLSSTNALLQTETRLSNALGELASVTDHLGGSTTYAYDAFGNLLSTTVAGPGGAPVTTSMTYDIRGRKLTMDDPDMGAWSYAYNALGELTGQTDAKTQTVTMTYDLLGRMVTRNEAEGLSTWIYDTAVTGIGKLHTVSGPNGYRESHAYDSLGRPSGSSRTIGGKAFSVSSYYDSAGRLDAVTYPSGFEVENDYNARGYLTAVRAPLGGTVYWQAQSVNAEGRVTAELLGNGVTTTRTYDAASGLIESIRSGNSGGTIRDLAYDFDPLGNLTARRDLRQDREELFAYDGLNRVLSATVNDSLALEQIGQTAYAYDSLGNIAFKSDVGSYLYGENGAGPHAVTTAGGNSYTYDANGNMVAGAGRTIAWTSFNKPSLVRETASGNETAFVYGPDRARIEQRILRGGLATTVRYVGNLYEEKSRLAQPDEQVHYIRAAGTLAIFTKVDDGLALTDKTRYLHKDHLGSVETVTDEAGAVVEYLAYDAHGKRRLADWQPGTPNTLNQETPRGFTGHEHLDGVGLIHMNGRVYDPTLGRFLSADPFVQAPDSTQSFNRYTYANNNPLSYTDPSGFFIKKIFKGFKKAFKAVGEAIGAVVDEVVSVARSVLEIPLVQTVGQIAAGGFGGPWGAAAYAGLVTVANGGSIGDGLLAAGITLGTAAVISGIEQIPGFEEVTFLSKEHFAKTLAHGVVGGVSSELRGGKFEAGFVSAAVANGLSAWQTTKWTLKNAPKVSLEDIRNAATQWDQVAAKAMVEGLAGAAVAKLKGDSVRFNALLYAATGFADSLYRAYVPVESQMFGPGGRGYPKADSEVDVVIVLGTNNWGKWWGPNAEPEFLSEGSPFSHFVDRFVPGMDAISLVHDVWAVTGRDSVCESDECFTTMLPAAALSFGSLYRQVRDHPH